MNDYEFCYGTLVLNLPLRCLIALDITLNQSSSLFQRLLTEFKSQGISLFPFPDEQMPWHELSFLDLGRRTRECYRGTIVPLIHWQRLCYGSEALTAKYRDVKLFSVVHMETENIIRITFMARDAQCIFP